MARFPTTFELKCSGCSFVIAQILIMIAWGLHAIDWNYYAVHTEADVQELHAVLSSTPHRAEVEAASTLMWLAFPFLLAALYGIRKFLLCIFDNTSGEMVVFVMEKAYVVFITIVCVFFPALRFAFFVCVFLQYTVCSLQSRGSVFQLVFSRIHQRSRDSGHWLVHSALRPDADDGAWRLGRHSRRHLYDWIFLASAYDCIGLCTEARKP